MATGGWTKVEEHSNKGYESSDMEDEHEKLGCWEAFDKDSVEDDGNDSNGDGKQ